VLKRSNKEFLIYLFRLIKEFIIELIEPKISFYAASMSWSTIFFIIPLFVIILSIVIYTPFFNEYYEKIHNLITQALVPTSSKQVILIVDNFIANASKMGYIGIIYVTIAAILFFRDFDFIVNDIFGHSRRSLLDAIKFYGLFLIIMPLIIVASIWVISLLKNYISFTNSLLLFLIIWILIGSIYKFAPKEEIPTNIAALSSFIATVVWLIAKSIFIFYILYNKTYTTIYGTVSMVLFTFLWIYISWMILLHGLQLCKILIDEED